MAEDEKSTMEPYSNMYRRDYARKREYQDMHKSDLERNYDMYTQRTKMLRRQNKIGGGKRDL